MNIESALSVLADTNNAGNRDLVREAADFLVANKGDLTARVAVPISPEELTDPAWANIVNGSWTSCVCGEADCQAQFMRVIGPELRRELNAGEVVVLTPGNRVFLRLAGTTHLLQSIEVDAANGGLLVETTGLEPAAYSLAGIGAQLATLPADSRTLRARGADGFLVVVSRLESVDTDTNQVTVTLDADVEQFEVRTTLIEGDTVVVEPGKKVYLRKKGTPDNAALRAYWVDAERQGLFIEDEPLSAMAQLAVLFGGGPRGYGLKDLADVVPLSVEQRTISTRDAQGLPVVLLRLEAVSLLESKVTLLLDADIEAYDPPADVMDGGPLQRHPADLLGGIQVIRLSADDLVGEPDGEPEGQEGQ